VSPVWHIACLYIGMKNTGLKTFTLGIAIFGCLSLGINGLVNTAKFNDISFMTANHGIKFEKSLDEMTGKIEEGRLTASALPWNKLQKKKIVKTFKRDLSKKVTTKTKSSFVPLSFNKSGNAKNSVNHKIKNVPAPAINKDLNLTVSKFFHKEEIQGVSGSAKTFDGIIEEVSINLPDGRNININTNEKMVGNVFYYEDTNTNEMKSGMFYEVKKGTYMITLTNDSTYQGARIELTSGDGSVIERPASANWNSTATTLANENINNNETQYVEKVPVQEKEMNYYETQEEKQKVHNFNFSGNVNPQGV
jgi:hypothetical protein